MNTRKRIFTPLGLVASSLALVFLSAPSTFAAELNLDVTPYWNGSTLYSQTWQYDFQSTTTTSDSWWCSHGTDITDYIRYVDGSFGSSISSYVKSGDLFEINISSWSNSNSNLNFSVVSQISDYRGNFDVVDVNLESGGNSAALVKVILMAKKNSVYRFRLIAPNNATWMAISSAGGVQQSECVSIGQWTAYRLRGDGTQSIIDAINNNNSSQAIEDAKDAIIDAVDSQSTQQHNDYTDEKNTINSNGSTATNNAGNLSFNGFSIGNPLLNWLSLFSDNACVSIPTIANWIHSNESQVCSPWSSTVRSVTTPIISVLSGTVLFGFIVRWLKQKDGQELS